MTTPMLGPSHPDFDKGAAATPGAATQVVLPSSPEMRRWVERTHHEREALKVRAERLREQFEPIRKTLAGIERSIKVLDHFRAQVSVEGAARNGAPTNRPGKRGAPLPDGQWSRNHAACLMCGKTENTHKAKGYCSGCYDRRDRFMASDATNGVTP